MIELKTREKPKLADRAAFIKSLRDKGMNDEQVLDEYFKQQKRTRN